MANMQNIATFPLEVDVTMATGGARQGEMRLLGFWELDMVSVGFRCAVVDVIECQMNQVVVDVRLDGALKVAGK